MNPVLGEPLKIHVRLKRDNSEQEYSDDRANLHRPKCIPNRRHRSIGYPVSGRSGKGDESVERERVEEVRGNIIYIRPRFKLSISPQI